MKKKGWIGAYIVFLGLLCLSACQVKRPDNVLTDAKMEKVLYDFHLAKAMGDELPSHENGKRLLYMEYVYKKHGITKATFDSSMVWYARHPDVLVKVYDKVNERLKTQKEEINHLMALRGEKSKESQPGDSVDVWFGEAIYQLTGTPLDNKILFILPTDSNFQERDTLKWTARFRFIKGTSAPIMALQALYEKDTLQRLQPIERPGVETLWLAADTIGALKEIRGFIYYPVQNEGHSLRVDQISLMRYHAKDTITFTMTETPEITKDTVSTPKTIFPMDSTRRRPSS